MQHTIKGNSYDAADLMALVSKALNQKPNKMLKNGVRTYEIAGLFGSWLHEWAATEEAPEHIGLLNQALFALNEWPNFLIEKDVSSYDVAHAIDVLNKVNEKQQTLEAVVGIDSSKAAAEAQMDSGESSYTPTSCN